MIPREMPRPARPARNLYRNRRSSIRLLHASSLIHRQTSPRNPARTELSLMRANFLQPHAPDRDRHMMQSQTRSLGATVTAGQMLSTRTTTLHVPDMDPRVGRHIIRIERWKILILPCAQDPTLFASGKTPDGRILPEPPPRAPLDGRGAPGSELVRGSDPIYALASHALDKTNPTKR